MGCGSGEGGGEVAPQRIEGILKSCIMSSERERNGHVPESAKKNEGANLQSGITTLSCTIPASLPNGGETAPSPMRTAQARKKAYPPERRKGVNLNCKNQIASDTNHMKIFYCSLIPKKCSIYSGNLGGGGACPFDSEVE